MKKVFNSHLNCIKKVSNLLLTDKYSWTTGLLMGVTLIVHFPISGFKWQPMRKNIDDFYAWFWLFVYQAITPSQEVPRRRNRTLGQGHWNWALNHHHLLSHPSASSSARESRVSAIVGITYIVSKTECYIHCVLWHATISMYNALEFHFILHMSGWGSTCTCVQIQALSLSHMSWVKNLRSLLFSYADVKHQVQCTHESMCVRTV